MPSPIDPNTRNAILTDIRTGGKSRGAIAREHGVSTTTVSKIARDAGIEQPFSREQTKNATAAAVADNRSMRAALSRRLLEKAGAALDQMDQPHLVFSFGGKDNSYNDKVLDHPPTGDMRNLMVIAATAIDKHIVIDRHDSGAGLDETVGLLDRIMTGLKEKHGDGGDADARPAD